MRPTNGRWKCNKKSVQSLEQKQDLENWDFIPSGRPPITPPLPIFKNDNLRETPIERFERYQRQLCRAISACSLCPKGLKDHNYKHLVRDPHHTPSIWYKNIALIKMEPSDSDVNGIFYDAKNIIKKHGLNIEDFYYTTINKCPPHANTEIRCPYWSLESEALTPVWPKLWIICDPESAAELGLNYNLGKYSHFPTLDASRAYFTRIGHSSFETKLKLLANPRLRKRLFPF